MERENVDGRSLSAAIGLLHCLQRLNEHIDASTNAKDSVRNELASQCQEYVTQGAGIFT